MADNDKIIASIDIGTSKIIVLIAEIDNDLVRVFGSAIGVSAGVKNGVIVDIDDANNAVKKVIKQACNDCNTDIANVNINFSDVDLQIINKEGNTNVGSGAITEDDIDSAIMAATIIAIPANKRILDKVVNNFCVYHNNDTTIIDNPIDLQATLLSARVHMIIASNKNIDNIEYVVEHNNLGLTNIVLSSMASSAACITQTDKDNGVCLIDIGSAVSNISIFINGNILYSSALHAGGDKITEDIAYAFGTSIAVAQDLKIEHGRALKRLAGKDKLIKFKKIDDDRDYYLSSHCLIELIEQSYLALFSLIKQDIQNIKEFKTKKINQLLKSGFVLTGGAAAMIDCDVLFREYFTIRTSLARTNTDIIKGNEAIISSPIYSCALGLLLKRDDEYASIAKKRRKRNFFGKLGGQL